MKYVLLFFVSSVALYAKGVDINPGMWALTTTVQVPGVSFEIPPTVYSSCLKKKDLDPQSYKNMKNCKLLTNKITSTTVEGKMECTTGSVKSIYVAKMTYNKTTANGYMTVKTGDMIVTSKMSAHRTGECQ